MKSAPELWELVDDELQLRHWSARICGSDAEVEVTERDAGRALVWRCNGAKFKVKLEEKGFGTQVAIAAKSETKLKDSQLEELLDELAEPQRRPFSAV
jgi:hypothetical protein